MKSQLQAGSLNHRITIQALQSEQDDSDGNVVEQYVTVGEAWADVRPMSGREVIEGGLEQSKIATSIRIRYRAGMTRSMRVLHDGRTFHIESILPDPYSGREWLTLACVEVQQG